MLHSLITSKTRIRLLVKFFLSVTNSGYLRGLAQEMNENTNAIRKELNNLSEAGYILKEEQDGKIIYRANEQHSLFATLQQLIRKYVGIDVIVAQILSRMGDVHRIFIVGDYAQGIDSGVVEVVLEGTDLNLDYITQLAPKIQGEIDKEVRFYVTESFTGAGLLIFENK